MADSKLKKIFDSYASTVDQAVTWVDCRQRWYVTKSAFLCLNTDEADEPMSTLPGKKTFDKLKKDKTAVYPENFVACEVPGFKGDSAGMFVIAGLNAVSLDSKTSVAIPIEVPQRKYWLRDDDALEVWKKSAPDACALAFSKDGLAMIKLCDKEDYLYVVCATPKKPEEIKVTINNEQYKLLDWDDQTRSYKTILKEDETMEKIDLPDLSKDIESAVGVDLSALGIDPDKSEKEKREESKPEAPAEVKETAEAAPEEKQRRKRSPNKPKPLSVALGTVIEQLNAPVPDDMPDEAILAEIRQLRDLSLVVTRRMCNLATGRLSEIQNKLKAFEQIKALMK